MDYENKEDTKILKEGIHYKVFKVKVFINTKCWMFSQILFFIQPVNVWTWWKLQPAQLPSVLPSSVSYRTGAGSFLRCTLLHSPSIQVQVLFLGPLSYLLSIKGQVITFGSPSFIFLVYRDGIGSFLRSSLLPSLTWQGQVFFFGPPSFLLLVYRDR